MVLKLAILSQILGIECVMDGARMMVKRFSQEYLHLREWECDLIKDRCVKFMIFHKEYLHSMNRSTI